MGAVYATTQELAAYWRPLTTEEISRANVLLAKVSAEMRIMASGIGHDLDAEISENEDLAAMANTVCMDTVARILNQSTTDEAMSQYSQSAMGYTVSGTYLVPGGGSLVLKRDFKRLGLSRPQLQILEVFDVETERH